MNFTNNIAFLVEYIIYLFLKLLAYTKVTKYTCRIVTCACAHTYLAMHDCIKNWEYQHQNLQIFPISYDY